MTWTAVTEQSETWTNIAVEDYPRVFSRTAFSPRPVFDTGAASGIWTEPPEQSETWTAA